MFLDHFFSKIFILSISCLLLLSYSSKAFSSSEKDFDHIVVFGDSLSDSGNFFAILDNSIDPDNSNVKLDLTGRPSANSGYSFSNGSLLVEHIADSYGVNLRGFYHSVLSSKTRKTASKRAINLSVLTIKHLIGKEAYLNEAIPSSVKNKFEHMAKKSLKLNLAGKSGGTNFAIANATATENDPNIFKNTLSLNRQLNDFKNSALPKNLDYDKTLFIIFIGSNDIINLSFSEFSSEQSQRLLGKISESIIASINSLKQIGAKKILVISPPDVSKSPFYNRYRKNSLSVVNNVSLNSLYVKNDISNSISENFIDGSVKFFDLFSQMTSEAFIQRVWGKSAIKKFYTSYCFRGVDNYVKSVSSIVKIGISYHRNCSLRDVQNSRYAFFDILHPSPKLVKPVASSLLKFINSEEF